MAVHIGEMVVRGEIDNTEEGVTRGRVWLCGRQAALELRLAGDCWRDLAGARLRFSNPAPRAGGIDPETRQVGVVGDMTASRRVRAGAAWTNVLSLEWFSEADGRVVLEATGFELEMIERTWQMDADAEQAQKLANLHAMRDFLTRSVGRSVGDEGREESSWERRLLASERLAEAFREVQDKYRGEPDAERMEAFAMGWDGLLDAMASETETSVPPRDMSGRACRGKRPSARDPRRDDECPAERDHPLHAEAEQLFERARDLAGACRPAGSDAVELAASLRLVATRLAGALNSSLEAESGYVLALLNRCIEMLSRSRLLCTRLAGTEEDNDQQRALEALGDEIFMLRQELAELRLQMGGS